MKKKKDKLKAKNDEKTKDVGAKASWAQNPASPVSLIPSGNIPFGQGMIPVMPYAQGGAQKPVIWVDKKGLPPPYVQMMQAAAAPETQKDKVDSGAKGSQTGKSEVQGMTMPMNPMSYGMMGPSGLPAGMSAMIPTMNGMQGYSSIPISANSDLFKMFMQQSQNKPSDSTSERQGGNE
jgi:hypothetical protein